MNAAANKTAAESTASLFSALWSEYISAKRAGHVTKAAELKAQIDRFDSEVLGC